MKDPDSLVVHGNEIPDSWLHEINTLKEQLLAAVGPVIQGKNVDMSLNAMIGLLAFLFMHAHANHPDKLLENTRNAAEAFYKTIEMTLKKLDKND